jgi:hypothetical protein
VPSNTHLLVLSLALVAPVIFGGCSAQQLYGAGQAWQKNECLRIIDAQDRSRCLSSTATSYEQYKRERDAASAPR